MFNWLNGFCRMLNFLLNIECLLLNVEFYDWLNIATNGLPYIPQATELFHQKISIGPEYNCTCCHQLWYRSSVTKCNASLYQSCSREILDFCLTGVTSIDGTEWICGTCHSNLKNGKLPSCAKANKMSFPEKPDVLKDLTPLEERLISPRISFMQV